MEIERDAFIRLKEELSKAKVKSSFIKSDNPFDSPIFNGYETIQEYEDYLDSLMKSLFDEILENQVNNIPKSSFSHYLLELATEFEKLKGLISTENIRQGKKRMIFHHKYLNFENRDVSFSDYDDFINRTSEFIAIQLGIIDSITRFISKKIEVIDSSSINTMEARLVWEKSDTDLLELIVALVESRSIQNANKDITLKEAFDIFSDIFGIPLKDKHSKLSAARNRKKNNPQFLLKLQENLEEYNNKVRKRND